LNSFETSTPPDWNEVGRYNRKDLVNVSRSVPRPYAKPITASSVTTKSRGRSEVNGSVQILTIFDLFLAGNVVGGVGTLAARSLEVRHH
jgi:hypothetical protein